MNTLTNAYLRKFSSGTVAALLVFSGILFLVPFVAPVHATNTSPPTISITTGNPLLGTEEQLIAIQITNPSTNLYGLTAFTVTVPSGWVLNTCAAGKIFTSPACSGLTAEFSTGTGPTLAPSASDTVKIWVTAPAPTSPATYPYSGTFVTSVQDASSLAFYAGPSFTLEVIDPLTAYTFTAQPPTTYVAGSGALTVTVTQTPATTAEAGLTIDWSLTAQSGYGSGTYTLTSSSITTVSGGVATASATFSPSNHVPDKAFLTATVGTSTVAVNSGSVTTAPGTPAEVAFQFTNTHIDPFPSTYYISGEDNATESPSFGLTSAGATLGTLAEIPATVEVGVAVADHYGNPLPYSTAGLTVATISIQALSGGGGFDNGALTTALLTSVSCGTGVNCGNPHLVSFGLITYPYFQGFTYATVGKLQATITGTYPTAATPFTVGGSSGNIFTSAQAKALVAAPTVEPSVQAGAATPIWLNLTGSEQAGVPVTLGLCMASGANCATPADTTGYGGKNSGFGNPGGPQILAGDTSLATGSTTASFQAMYYVDTVATSLGSFNATATDPYNGASTFTLAWSRSAQVKTIPGSPATFTINFWYTAAQPTPGVCNINQCQDPYAKGVTYGSNAPGYVVGGTIVYPDATLADKFGNSVTNTSPFQIQVALTVSAGTLSAYNVYINHNGYDTWSSFGADAYYTPSSAAVGTTLTVSASGVVGGSQVSGSGSLTTVSAIPTFSITAPNIPSGGVIYTNNAATVFRGWANLSLGYDAYGSTTTNNIATIGYRVNGGHWFSATFTAQPDVNFAIAAFLNNGLNTVQFNCTDSVVPNIYVSQIYKVLVDTTLPGIKFPSTTSIGYGAVLPVTIFSDYGDLNTTVGSMGHLTGVTAFAGNNDLNVTAANLVGSNTLGSNSTFTLNLNNIPVGTWTLKVTASNFAGNTVVATETITVTVSFAQSVQYQVNSATWTTIGAYSGVLASWTNAWTSSQSLVVYAQLTNSTGSFVLPGSATIASGATVQVFCPNTILHLDAGSYTLTLFAVTTANNPVSLSTTINNFGIT